MKRYTKRAILVVSDASLILLAMFISFLFMDVLADIPLSYLGWSFFLVILVYGLVAWVLKVFSTITRFTSTRTLVFIASSLLAAFTCQLLLSMLFVKQYSLRFILLSFVFALIFVVSPRVIWRAINEKRGQKKGDKQKRTLVVGAGAGGNLFINTVLNSPSDIDIVGIVDNNPNKKNTYIQGKKVLGNRYDLPRLIEELDVEQVTIAIPSISKEERERIIDICNDCDVTVNAMPSVEDIILGGVSTASLKEINISDLLGRPEVVLNQDDLGTYFGEKIVLVTGAGGSIGSEICRQVAKFKPKQLLLLGHGENSIYLIHREMQEIYGETVEIIPLIADIQDRNLIFELMGQYRPDVVYHAAAHKHVPLMEYNPREAVKNNIFGTKNVAEAAKAAGVKKFVMVSTDKAVNPPNVMGATKRVAEMIVTNLNEPGKTQFSAVRFGNVLGSRGSVVPLFKEQIAKGGPVTVTDFRMTRYFMTIPEASRLVIQAGYMAKGGEIFVLDMGEPVLIKDLAKKVIKLSGHRVEEIGIIESGIRPGEKLYEELLSTEERVSEQIYDKIFVGRVQNQPKEVVEAYIEGLQDLDIADLKKSLITFANAN